MWYCINCQYLSEVKCLLYYGKECYEEDHFSSLAGWVQLCHSGEPQYSSKHSVNSKTRHDHETKTTVAINISSEQTCKIIRP